MTTLSRRALAIAAALVLACTARVGLAAPGSPAEQDMPVRVLDTRIGQGLARGRLDPGAVARLAIPSMTTSGDAVLLLNLTAVDATGPGHVSAWSCDHPRPETSILNFVPGHAAANMIALPYTEAGICLSTVTPVHLIADLTATTTTAHYQGVTPNRLLDTRRLRPLRPYREHRVHIGGSPGIPVDAPAAAINVTVVAGSEPGWIRVAPCGAGSEASTVNFQGGEVVAHFTFAGLMAGDACVTPSTGVDVVIDSFGWMPAGSGLRTITPTRLLDTRIGLGGTAGAARDGQLITLEVAGRAGIPRAANTATINIVAVDGTAFGHLTVWPCGRPEPVSSMLNMWPGVLRSNQAAVPIPGSGDICIRPRISDDSAIDIVVDAVGFSTTPPTGSAPVPTTPRPSPTSSSVPAPSPPTSIDGPAASTTTTGPPSMSVPGGRFGTLAPGAALPSGSQCAARVRPAPEIRPANTTSNNNRGGPQYANNDPAYNGWFHRVDGDFAGTTDEIIQWAACKWGIDEDLVRAQIIKESWWNQHNPPGDNGESWGLGQVRRPYHSWAFEHDQVNAINSSAYNLDYTYAVWRGCFEGLYTWLNQTNERNGTYTAGDAWGCMGVWYSGRWYHNTDDYLNAPGDSVRWHYDNRTWLTPDFINSN